MESEQQQPRRSPEEQKELEARIHQLMEERVSFNQHLGLKIQSLSGDECTMHFAMRPELVGHFLYGRLHGGVISSALDATAGVSILAAQADKHKHESADQVMERFKYIGTIDLRVDYLRSGQGTSFTARSVVTRLGRRIASTQMELINEANVLIATGAGSYIVS
ncbi:MAG: thioesterase family protein [Burkholderiaceae bacterium]